MSETVISVENLSKKYRIRHQQRERYTALRDVIANKFAAPFRWLTSGGSKNGSGTLPPNSQFPPPISQHLNSSSPQLLTPSTPSMAPAQEDFWALRDISFAVKQGEVIGIIGRNGAGKSTLLKILSRITEPTKGRVRIKGRVASLLEVGTGFHQELTGRENIFLNGAILGMTREEIKRKFDEIVGFAEIEKFLDTPVKHYSSGMYVRLAFAVAAHLEPEILVVDEVLAVGDAEFQKKCLGKMQDVSKGGRTVLFVSHNMATVNRLCQRAILLDSGSVKADGETHSITGYYMTSGAGMMAARCWNDPALRPGDKVARLVSARVLQHDAVSETVDIRFPIEVEMVYENLQDGAQLIASFAFFDPQGVHLFAAADFADKEWAIPRPRGRYRSVCTVPGNLFAEGDVRVAAEVSTRHPVYQIHFLEFDSVAFQVVDTGQPGSVRAGWGRPIPGVMRPECQWRTAAEFHAGILSIPSQPVSATS